MAYAKIKHIHNANGFFGADLFQADCSKKLSHQNAHFKHAIQINMYMTRTLRLHASLHQSEHDIENLVIWPLAVKCATWLYNQMPNEATGLTSLKLLPNTCFDHCDLLRTHVWVCPTYMLDLKLQTGHKIPKVLLMCSGGSTYCLWWSLIFYSQF